MAKLESIQVLRALAAVMVVLFHTKTFTQGYAGVDIFFVISGFIMGTVGIKETPVNFFRQRLIRIAPLYWTMTLIMCGFSLIPHFFRNFRFDAESLIKSVLFIPYVDQAGHVWPLVIAGWTLNYEMFFYLVFTLGLVIGRPRFFSSSLMLLLIFVGFLGAKDGAFAQTYTDPILLEFVAGMALSARAPLGGLRLGLAQLMAGAGAFAVIGLTGFVPGDGVPRLIFLGLPSLLLVSGALSVERAGYWPRLTFAVVLGDASYSLYLTHGFVVSAAEKVSPLHPYLNAIAVLLISCIAAVLCYRCFEAPLTRLLRRYTGPESKTAKPNSPAGAALAATNDRPDNRERSVGSA
ncbi:acyltransferase [Bradyrhizobium sp. STM 3809]|uniref:acyltransferase family protein n=1 Tax=Bradyrhizobium sp. STM 3809 TaxID=551936 RepID=UPI00024065A2|nr:acyltransferase [Bradyrhizobium sp. STM 3809]CCD99466.1 Acyltransferase 3 [Bradyrhizobium sp. STM 3809]